MPLLQSGTITTNTSTTPKIIPGGAVYFGVSGTLGGGTLIAELSTDGGLTYQPLTDSTTPNLIVGTLRAEVPEGMIKLTLTGATSPSLVYSISTRGLV